MTTVDLWLQRGMQQGIQQGIQQGMQQGKLEGKREDAFKIIELTGDFKLASRVTGLPEDELKYSASVEKGVRHTQ